MGSASWARASGLRMEKVCRDTAVQQGAGVGLAGLSSPGCRAGLGCLRDRGVGPPGPGSPLQHRGSAHLTALEVDLHSKSFTWVKPFIPPNTLAQGGGQGSPSLSWSRTGRPRRPR